MIYDVIVIGGGPQNFRGCNSRKKRRGTGSSDPKEKDGWEVF